MNRFFSLFAVVAIFLGAQSAQANNFAEVLAEHYGKDAIEAAPTERFILDWNTPYGSNYNSVASDHYDAGNLGRHGVEIIRWETPAGIQPSFTNLKNVRGVREANSEEPYSFALWLRDWTATAEPEGAEADLTRSKVQYLADGRRSDPADAGDLLLSMAPINDESFAFVKSWDSKDIGMEQGNLAFEYFAKFDPADAGVLLEPM